MFITVIICTRDRADSLRQTLDSLFTQSNLQCPGWETLVMDNDSEDHTGQVCRDFRERFLDIFASWLKKNVGRATH